MAILTYPLNGIIYDAEDAEVYNCTRTSGVFASDGHFPASVTGSRTVTIGPGLAWMQNEEFHGKAVYNPEDVDLTIAEADAYQGRIDRIVLQFDKLLNQTTLIVKEGTPASSPKAPDIERTELIYELGLYTVTVGASTISVKDSDISSTVLDESVCGIMRDAVEGIPTQELYDQWYSWFVNIQEDTETFEAQFNLWFEDIKEQAEKNMADNQEEFETWMTDTKENYDTWFDNLEDILDGDVAGHLALGIEDAQDTADEALEQLATGIVTGFVTDEAEGGEYALLADDNDENYGITISRPICNCGDNENTIDIIADPFSSGYTYSKGEYCIYDGTLFRFTADKSRGAWDYSVVQITTVGTELTACVKDETALTKSVAANTNAIAEQAQSISANTLSIKQQGEELEKYASAATEQEEEIKTCSEAVTALDSEYKIQAGNVANIEAKANGTTSIAVLFATEFDTVPFVTMTISDTVSGSDYSSITLTVKSRQTASFNIQIINSGDTALTLSINWIAVGGGSVLDNGSDVKSGFQPLPDDGDDGDDGNDGGGDDGGSTPAPDPGEIG